MDPLRVHGTQVMNPCFRAWLLQLGSEVSQGVREYGSEKY